mgnify:FL=1
MYDSFRPFTWSGRLTESNIVTHKEHLEHELSTFIRDQGFVEVLDIEAQWSINWNNSEECFDFQVTIYGVECEEPWDTAGLLAGKMIPKSTVKTKSVQS